MPIARARAALTVLAVLVRAGPAPAQTIRLTVPDAALDEEFSAIRGVRELADGRILVSDYIDERVVLVDLERGTVSARVRRGGGPQEARLPSRLVPLPGDSTLLVDLGNNRFLVLDGQGRAARTTSATRTGVMGVRAVDAQGAFYYAFPGWAEGTPLPNDSVRIVRWNPRTGVEETVAVVQGERMRSDIRKPALVARIPTVGYAAQDGWTVTAAGVVRIVRAGGYRVESHAPASRPVVGPGYAYATRPVTGADRESWVRRFLASSPTSGRGEGGGMGHSPAVTGAELAALVRSTEFAERHPMFASGAVVAGPDGQLWVGRPAADGAPVLYDVFDEAGRRLRIAELRPGRRIMAFGRRHLYVVHETELGLEYLERYPLPR